MAGKENTTQNEKPSYNDLLRMLHEMGEQLRDKTRMERMQETGACLNYLFKVIENKDMFPKEYVDGCVEDIMQILPKQQAETASEEGEK